MKLNKTLMIVALVAGGMIAAAVAVQAQDSTNTPATPPAGARPPGGPGARGRMTLESIATQLALTDDQKTKVKPVLEERQQKMTELRKDTTIQPTDKRAKAKEIMDDANAKLKEIFTPEQYDKWMKMPQNRGPRGGAGAPPAAAPGATPPPAGGAQ